MNTENKMKNKVLFQLLTKIVTNLIKHVYDLCAENKNMLINKLEELLDK